MGASGINNYVLQNVFKEIRMDLNVTKFLLRRADVRARTAVVVCPDSVVASHAPFACRKLKFKDSSEP